MKNGKNKPHNGVKTVLISGLFGFGAAAGISWIAAVVLEGAPKFENLLAAVSLAVSVLAGLAAGLPAGLASEGGKPLKAFAACSVTLLLLAAWGILTGAVAAVSPMSALRAALTAAPAPLILLAAGAAPKRPKRRRRR